MEDLAEELICGQRPLPPAMPPKPLPHPHLTPAYDVHAEMRWCAAWKPSMSIEEMHVIRKLNMGPDKGGAW